MKISTSILTAVFGVFLAATPVTFAEESALRSRRESDADDVADDEPADEIIEARRTGSKSTTWGGDKTLMMLFNLMNPGVGGMLAELVSTP